MSVTVVFGSDGGTTRSIAHRIGKRLSARIVDVGDATVSDFEDCSLLILGCPTYGLGDLQDDWDHSLETLRSANLAGKQVALFGTGDQLTYPDTFLDAIGILYDEVLALGATVVGQTDVDGFDYIESFAERDGKFVGLAIDEDQQPEKTTARIDGWIAVLR